MSDETPTNNATTDGKAPTQDEKTDDEAVKIKSLADFLAETKELSSCLYRDNVMLNGK